MAIVLVGLVVGALLRAPPDSTRTGPTAVVDGPAAGDPTPDPTPEAHPADWTAGAGVDVLLKVVDRRFEPWPATLTRGGETRPVPSGTGMRVRAEPGRVFGRLGGERLAARDWRPAASDRWEEQADGSFEATVMLYPGKRLDVELTGPGAGVVQRVRCIDGDRRGVTCEGPAPAWACDCRVASRIAVFADRWSVPWVSHRTRFEDGPAEVPPAVTACMRFPDVPEAERSVVVIAPQGLPRESAKEADSRAVAAGAEICVRAPAGEPLLVGLGATLPAQWSGRDGEPPPGTRTWQLRPTSDGSVVLPDEGGLVPWPTSTDGGG